MSNQLVGAIPADLAYRLAEQNPWWTGRSMRPLPDFKRWPFAILYRRLIEGKGLAPIQVLRGPRQIGKTTLQEQLIDSLLKSDCDPKRIIRVQFDDIKSLIGRRSSEPILNILRHFERAIFPGGDFNQAARAQLPAYIFLDEVQNLSDWPIQLKTLVDHSDVRMFVTGSSALRIKQGTDSLAGRLQSLEAGPLRLSEIAAVNRIDFWQRLVVHGCTQAKVRDESFEIFSERGGYPLAQNSSVEWSEIAAQLNEVIINRVIEHDLRIGEKGAKRDENLLKEVFRVAARYCGQSPKLKTIADEINSMLSSDLGTQRIYSYLQFLNDSLLIRLIEPLELKLKKRRNPSKICLSDHALRSAWLAQRVSLLSEKLIANPAESEIVGRVSESIVGAYLASMTGLDVKYAPMTAGKTQQLEVDFVIGVGDIRIPIEVKYQNRIDPLRDMKGLIQYLDNPANRAAFGLLVVREDRVEPLPDSRIIAVPLKTLLLVR
jgi:predicted AAA+ superfamily ATPase